MPLAGEVTVIHAALLDACHWQLGSTVFTWTESLCWSAVYELPADESERQAKVRAPAALLFDVMGKSKTVSAKEAGITRRKIATLLLIRRRVGEFAILRIRASILTSETSCSSEIGVGNKCPKYSFDTRNSSAARVRFAAAVNPQSVAEPEPEQSWSCRSRYQ
jgi:hypothetical protein